MLRTGATTTESHRSAASSVGAKGADSQSRWGLSTSEHSLGQLATDKRCPPGRRITPAGVDSAAVLRENFHKFTLMAYTVITKLQ